MIPLSPLPIQRSEPCFVILLSTSMAPAEDTQWKRSYSIRGDWEPKHQFSNTAQLLIASQRIALKYTKEKM